MIDESPVQITAAPEVTDAVWDQMTGDRRLSTKGKERASIIDLNGHRYFQVKHPANTTAGFNMASKLTPARGRVLEFIANFAPDFDFGNGDNSADITIDRNHGKFGFGFAGGRGDLYTIASGGDVGRNGYSFRLVWRGGDDVATEDDNATVRGYGYWNNRYFLDEENRDDGSSGARAPGDEIPPFRPQFARQLSSAKIIRGVDQHYRIELFVNTVDENGQANADGSVRVWQDGKLFIDENRLAFMNGDVHTPTIDKMPGSSFHGGGNRAYRPVIDSKIRYRQLKSGILLPQ